MTQPMQPLQGLALWEDVQTTDPAYTRRFTRSSGFEGTAINPTYLVRKATEKFGPFGLGWGVEPLKEEYREGHIIGFPADGGSPIRVVVHVLLVELWFKLNGERGSVKQFGQTTFVGKTSDGTVYTNEEAPKMSMTDGMCKCLSWLGFGADVHLGLYDDIKYVADLEAAFSQGLMPTARNATQYEKQGDLQHGDDAGTTGSDKGPQLSARYTTYRERLKSGNVADKSTARKVIEQDKLLNEFERNMLLASAELKDPNALAAIDEAQGAHKKGSKGGANAIDTAFL